jgi:hypothetical protein
MLIHVFFGVLEDFPHFPECLCVDEFVELALDAIGGALSVNKPLRLFHCVGKFFPGLHDVHLAMSQIISDAPTIKPAENPMPMTIHSIYAASSLLPVFIH